MNETDAGIIEINHDIYRRNELINAHKYEVLDDVVQNFERISLLRRQIFDIISIIKMDKYISKDKEIALLIGIERAICLIMSGIEWETEEIRQAKRREIEQELSIKRLNEAMNTLKYG